MPRLQLRREDAVRLLALVAAWAAFFIAVDPRGQFPLNDDFQYAECARRWLSGGGVHLPEWALSSTITHALLGAAATAAWGASNEALRMWMLVVGLAGAVGVYALARRWDADPDAALLAAELGRDAAWEADQVRKFNAVAGVFAIWSHITSWWLACCHVGSQWPPVPADRTVVVNCSHQPF